MAPSLLSDLATEIFVPASAVIGIAFALAQWFIVSRVKLSPESPANRSKNGFTDSLIEEEDGVNDPGVVAKCAEIQQAISEVSRIM